MRKAMLLLSFVLALPAGAAETAFTSTIDVAAGCNDVWTTLTEFARLQKLVPHLHGTANVARASQLGDALYYSLDQKDGSKKTGKFVVTSLEPAYKLQVMVQPDEGPWLRVQEFTLYEKAAQKKDAKAACHVTYEEAFNPFALKYENFDTSGVVTQVRESYMQIILRRLKNVSEGRDAGPADEAAKLAEVAKNFP
jgi:hypothetical protein